MKAQKEMERGQSIDEHIFGIKQRIQARLGEPKTGDDLTAMAFDHIALGNWGAILSERKMAGRFAIGEVASLLNQAAEYLKGSGFYRIARETTDKFIGEHCPKPGPIEVQTGNFPQIYK